VSIRRAIQQTEALKMKPAGQNIFYGNFPEQRLLSLHMRYSLHFLTGGFLLSAFSQNAVAQQIYPIPGLVDESAGYLESILGRDRFRGSGVVARSPRLIYSCAHLFYEDGRWATNYLFYRAWHSDNFPNDDQGAAPRGLRYFTSYSSNAQQNDGNNEQAFAVDFSVLYGSFDFGPAKSTSPDGAAALKSNAYKRIVGYPAKVDFTRENGDFYQHSTDGFSRAAYKQFGSYYGFDDVSTGPGNSGGPVNVLDDLTGTETLAGILVSGNRRSAGVIALDIATDTLASRALGLKSRTATFRNDSQLAIPDKNKSYSTSDIQVSGFSGSTEKLKFSMSAKAKRRGDLDVFLRSPSGRIRWINKHEGGNASNLKLKKVDFTKNFSGVNPNGTWQLKMRDVKKGNPATFENCAITISAL
jgi:hypothetical protein